MEVQAEVPVGHWKARLRRAERAREAPRWRACASLRSWGAEASWMANAGRKLSIAEELPCAMSSSSWYSRRKTPASPTTELAASSCPRSSPRASKPQYSLKNISPSSSVIFLTATGFIPAPILAAISSRFCITRGSGSCADGGKAAPLLCASAEVAYEERRSSEGKRATRKCGMYIGEVDWGVVVKTLLDGGCRRG